MDQDETESNSLPGPIESQTTPVEPPEEHALVQKLRAKLGTRNEVIESCGSAFGTVVCYVLLQHDLLHAVVDDERGVLRTEDSDRFGRHVMRLFRETLARQKAPCDVSSGA